MDFIVICQNIRSLFNVGSIFRSADCFGVSKIFLTGITGTPPRPEISKVALGAENFVDWEYCKQPKKLIQPLRAKGFSIVALEKINIDKIKNASLRSSLKSKIVSLDLFRPRFPIALLLGHETKGLPRDLLDLADQILEIPMHGKKENLNVSVAFGIAACYIASHFKGRKWITV